MSDPAFTAAASRLCLACGMCCNGVLFQIVRLQAEDSPRELEKLGMALSRKKTEPYFNQPCRFLDNCTCQIYSQRPSRCRQFECRQIVALAGGDTSEAEAAAVIARIHDQVRRVTLLLSAPEPGPHSQAAENEVPTARPIPLMERCRDALRSEETANRRELEHEARKLNAMLNTHLRYQPVEIPEDWH